MTNRMTNQGSEHGISEAEIKNLTRHEDARLITGTGKFTDDWDLPHQLHAAVVRSDVAHGKITELNLDDAKSAPGVVSILTADDVAAAGFNPIARGPDLKEGLYGPANYNAMPILAADKVMFVGQPIAMVIADSPSRARDAAALVYVEYEELGVCSSPTASLKMDATALHENSPDNLSLHFNQGNKNEVEAAFAAASKTAAITIESQRLVGAPMEPRACNASFDQESGVTTVYTPMQGLLGMRGALVDMTNLDPEHLEVIAEDVGGSFGLRAGAFSETALVVLAARKLGKPVKWLAQRSELFIGEWHGRGLTLAGELAVDDDHNITAIRFNHTVDLGAFNAYFGGFIGTNNLYVTLGGPYRVPALYMESKLVYTNCLPVSAYRGAGRPDIAFAIERLIDHAAADFGLDPIAFRKQNFIPLDAFPYKTANGSEYDCGDFHGVMDKALQISEYSTFPERAKSASDKGLLRGIGIGYYIEKSGAGGAPKDQVSVRFNDDGRLMLHAVTGPSGQGHETSFAQIVGEGLSIPTSLIGYRAGDAAQGLIGNGTGGSRSLYAVGSAFKNLVNSIIEKGMPLAAGILDCDVKELSFDAGHFQSKDGKTIDLVALAKNVATPGTDRDHPMDCDAQTITGANYPNGCHIAEIEIDQETGVTTVVTYTAVDDLGNVITPFLVEGQVHGGVVQGIGQAFGENVVYDESGQLLSGSFMDYSMPRAGSLKEFRIGSYPVPTKLNELGAKGVGESGCSGSLPAVSNAVNSALRTKGLPPIDMPYTPEKIWQALSKATA